MTESTLTETMTNDAEQQFETELEKVLPEPTIDTVSEVEINIEKELNEAPMNTEAISETIHIESDEIETDEIDETDEMNETDEDESEELKLNKTKTPKKEPAITISYLAKNIESKKIRTNKDFEEVIKGHWEYKKGITGRELQKATKAAQVIDGESKYIDMDILKKNLRKVLVKIKNNKQLL